MVFRIVILNSVGASLIFNYARSMNFNVSDLKNSDENDLVSKLIDFINKNKLNASAEVNSLERILAKLRSDNYSPQDILIEFLISDTWEGAICGKVLKKYYEKLGYFVNSTTIKGLKYDAKDFLEQGLLSLVNEVSEKIFFHVRERKRVIINATGGFKAEAAYITLVGLINRCEVYYIHEKFNAIVNLPPLPIKIDEDFWRKYGDIIDYLKEERDLSDARQKFGERLNHVILLAIVKEKNGKKTIKLGPAGFAFYLAAEEKKLRRD